MSAVFCGERSVFRGLADQADIYSRDQSRRTGKYQIDYKIMNGFAFFNRIPYEAGKGYQS